MGLEILFSFSVNLSVKEACVFVQLQLRLCSVVRSINRWDGVGVLDECQTKVRG